MDDHKLSRRRTQIDDLPSCLIIDVLSRVPIETLVISRFVCKSWFLLFSDPLFVRLHSALSPPRILMPESRLKIDLKSYKPVGAMLGKDFKIDFKAVMKPGSVFRCANSCHGLLCLSRGNSKDEIYVCNPILGEYITIPTVNRGSLSKVKSFLGFCSRSNQFKVLQIDSIYMAAEIYTIGNGTLQWKSIGIAPICTTFDFPDGSLSSFLNGSIHWADRETHQIVYFDFESEQFGSLPAPPAWLRDGRWSKFSRVRVGVSDGCLGIYAFRYPAMREKWAMKEYGVEESWTEIFSTHNNNNVLLHSTTFPTFHCTYSPSFISLQDVAKSEHFTALSRTRSDSQEVISNIIFQLWK